MSQKLKKPKQTQFFWSMPNEFRRTREFVDWNSDSSECYLFLRSSQTSLFAKYLGSGGLKVLVIELSDQHE